MIKPGGNTIDFDAIEWIHDRGPVGSIYDNAYTVTNENLYGETQLTPDAKDVLTIAGSGDQALFYTLNGATNIDTFDITISAAAIQEIKFAALKMNIPYNEYIQLLRNLHFAKNILDVKYIPEILERIDPLAAYYIRGCNTDRIFSYGLPAAPHYNNIISPTEYTQLQNMQKPAPTFYWGPAQKISEQLGNKQYDAINLSNIFDRKPECLPNTITKLSRHLKPKGKIIIEEHNPLVEQLFNQTTKNAPLKNIGQPTKIYEHNWLVFQRTR